MLRGWGVRLRALLGRDAIDADVAEELRAHLDAETARNVAKGLTPEDARAAARRAMGNLGVAREAARDALVWLWLDMVARDTRFAWRSLRRSPGFVAIAVLSLGVAIGLGTTAFSMLEAIVAPYTPVERPNELALVGTEPWGHVSPDMYSELAKGLVTARDFPWRIVPMEGDFFRLASPEGVIDLDIEVVGADFFTVLGSRALVGRVFTWNDTSARPSPVVISFGLWSMRFNRERHLSQLRVTLADGDHPVAGVMPPEMKVGAWGRNSRADLWEIMPEPEVPYVESRDQPLTALVRFGSDGSTARVTAALEPTRARVAALFPGGDHVIRYGVRPLVSPPASLQGIHLALGGAALLVLLIASLNLANLMMARGLARRREFAVRIAIGASRQAIVRCVLAECAMLAVAGGVAGTVMSSWGVHLLEFNMPKELSAFGFIRPHLGWPVIAAAILITLLAVLVSSLVPALRARDGDAADAMKDGGAGSTAKSNRWYRGLAIAEVGGALVLVTASGLLTRAAIHVSRISYAYDAQHLYSIYTNPSRTSCPYGDSTSLFYGDLARRMEQVPGIRFASAIALAQPDGHIMTAERGGGPFQRTMTSYTVATPDYYRTLGVPIVQGRDFEPGDMQTGDAAIVNQYTASRFWPLESAVGQALKLGPSASNARWVRVVGVARQPARNDEGDGSLGWIPDVVVAGTAGCSGHDLKVRMTNDDPRSSVLVRRALAAALPAGGYGYDLRWEMSGQKAELANRTFMAALFISLAAFVLLLAVVGVYGVLSYVVGQRMREFATRVALGASSRDLLRLVLRDALIMVLGGIGIGAFFAMGFGQLFDFEWLNRIPGSDVVALFGAELAVVVVTLAACVGPALKAARANPIDILRST